MKFFAAVVVLVLGSLLTGCTTPSLNRLGTPETIVTDAGLVGRWVDSEDKDTTYVVSEAGEKGYHLEGIPKDPTKQKVDFDFQLVQLGKSLFIDLTVSKAAREEVGNRWGTAAIPAYVFMEYKRVDRDVLKVRLVKDSALGAGLKDGTFKLAHAVVGPLSKGDQPTYVLTAATAELQEFFLKNADNKDLWDKAVQLERQGAASAPKEEKK